MDDVAEDRGAYRRADAARWLGISQDKLDKLISSGEIRSFKDGSVRLISRRALIEWLDRREAEAC
jgi:excisionase family DNA binding protein